MLTREFAENGATTLEVPSAVPTPTQAYSVHLAEQRLVTRGVRPVPQAQPVPHPTPGPPLRSRGARVLIWKQDPVVKDMGIRPEFLPKRVLTGPEDARIAIGGMPVVAPNVFGDFIIDPAAHPDDFDTVHSFAVVRMVLTLYERFQSPTPVPWQWNTGGNTDRLEVWPHAGVTQNAYYTRSEKALKFFYFDTGTPPEAIYTCRSLDIVAHETGHAVLDGLKPGWLGIGNPPQTGALHESFGDLTAIFLALSQLDQVEAIIAQTKANLHAKSFLADLAEQFGLALGRPNGLRNADNDLKLSQVGTEVHELSQVFTGGIYDVLADIFAFERKPGIEDEAFTLYKAGHYVMGLVFRALAQSPSTSPTFADVVNKMLQIATADGKVEYKQFVINRFALREVLAPAALELAAHEAVEVAPGIQDAPDAVQDRSGCCGTMQLDEYVESEESLEAQLEELQRQFTTESRRTRSRATTGARSSRK
ncbi:MAG: hypothetical protein C5B48_14955 [Candidatus Rokuibacteriota bacterium]|nr:MAG: hypothetical protein C5B48_14955 [Candidatus Rokubacteria bacterium]